MFNLDFAQMLASLPAIIIAMAIHEYAHARVAYMLGDDTPLRMGRLTLNPLAHIDPLGLIALFIAHFGWAKPVSINPYNFKDYRRDNILVSIAGPAANLLIAFFALVVLNSLHKAGLSLSKGTVTVIYLIVIYNINFAIFNMLPIPPLDGSHLITSFLPYRWMAILEQYHMYSFIILLIVINSPLLSMVLVPLQRTIYSFFNILLSLIF